MAGDKMIDDKLEILKDELIKTADENKWRVHEKIGAYFHDIGDAEGAVQAYLNAAQCDKYLRSQRTHFSNYLFALHYLNGVSNEDLAHEHFIYNNLYGDNITKDEPLSNINANNKITVGYIAPHFLESSSARFYEALLTNYSRDKFIVKCFSLSSDSDTFTDKIKSNVDKYIMLANTSIEEAAQTIFNENVDILFDLGGHTEGGMTLQIMSYKTAPIQISGIGYFDTTGLSAVDYILTDNYLAPIGHEKFFTEKLIRLSGLFAFMPTEQMSRNILDTAHDIKNTNITFGCFNNFMKVTDDYLKCVKKILQQVDEAHFILQDTTAIPERKANMMNRIKHLKLPINRVEIRLGNDDYLKDYADIDIMLDTFPYNGGTMTATALYMNVPVISLYGSRHSSRFGADILRLAGLTDLIANSNKDYISFAVELAFDSERLNNLKRNMRNNLTKSKLFDIKLFVSEVEYQYERIVNFKMRSGK